MVGEDEILPAPVYVEGGAKVLLAHRRALDVPARTALAPRALPGDAFGLPRLRRLPEREVEGIAFQLAGIDARARQEVVEVALGELPVLREAPDREVDVAARLVGVASGNELFDERDHLGNMLGGLGLDVRGRDPERCHVALALLDVAGAEDRRILAALARAPDDLVVDVGPVPHVGDLEPAPAQEADRRVEGDEEAGVADVRQIVDRDAADVDPDPAGRRRGELLFAIAQRIREAKRHSRFPDRVPEKATGAGTLQRPRPQKMSGKD